MSLLDPVHHILVDFENVSKFASADFGDQVVKVTFFLGPKQRKIDAVLLEQLMTDANQVHLVRLTTSGKNALDFTLSYYLGREVSGDPTGVFHIVSKDAGFDPLVQHLERQRVKTFRWPEFAEAIAHITKRAPVRPQREKPRPAKVTPVAPATLPPPIEAAPLDLSIDEVIAHMRKREAHRPTRRGKLVAMLKNHFHLNEAEAEDIIRALLATDKVAIDPKDKVAYHL